MPTAFDNLRRMIEEMATEDSHLRDTVSAVHNPIFVVEQHHMVAGLLPEYGDEILWNVHDGGGMCTQDDALEYYDIVAGDKPGCSDVERLLEAGAEDHGVAYVWVFVSAHFSRGEAERYVKRYADRLTNPRITVESQYRCPGMTAVRVLLLALHDKPDEIARLLDGRIASGTTDKE
jgi:hypothetical protein